MSYGPSRVLYSKAAVDAARKEKTRLKEEARLKELKKEKPVKPTEVTEEVTETEDEASEPVEGKEETMMPLTFIHKTDKKDDNLYAKKKK